MIETLVNPAPALTLTFITVREACLAFSSKEWSRRSVIFKIRLLVPMHHKTIGRLEG